jgi:hypothetical protein
MTRAKKLFGFLMDPGQIAEARRIVTARRNAGRKASLSGIMREALSDWLRRGRDKGPQGP